jgi:Acetyl-coenzyme A synthetase N-terminus
MSYPYQITSFDDYKTAWTKSIKDPEGFWGEIAEHFLWRKKWDKVLSWNFKEPQVKWFEGGKLISRKTASTATWKNLEASRPLSGNLITPMNITGY